MNYGGASSMASKDKDPPKEGLRKPKTEKQNMVAYLIELVAAGADERNWKGIAIALLVIITICSLIVLAIVLLTPGDPGDKVKKQRFTIEDILSDEFRPRRFNGSWVSGNQLLYRDENGALSLYEIDTRTKRILISNTTFRQYNIQKYSLSPDHQYVLLVHDIRKIFRHSYTAKYMIFNFSNELAVPLLPNVSPHGEFQHVEWGTSGNQLVVVFKNDVYYLPHVMAKPQRLSDTGMEGMIFNGITDWLYAEEILHSTSAIWWLNDGSKLCYATFNDSEVDVIKRAAYGSYNDSNNIYPQMKQLRYPKAGRENPIVTLWVVDLGTQSPDNPIIHQVQPPKEIQNRDHYLTSVVWNDPSQLVVTWARRAQNYSVVSICTSPSKWACEKSYEEESHIWVDLFKAPIFTPDKKDYFLLLPVADGVAGDFRHVAVIGVETKTKHFLTHGLFDVTELLAYGESNKSLYFQATLEGKSGQRHIFSVTDMKSENPRSMECLTCDMGEDCLYNKAIFSPDANYYILECLGPGIPRIELREVHGNKLVKVLDTNSELAEAVDSRALPFVKTFHVPLDGGYKARVRLYLPPDLDEEEVIKFPLVVHVDASPGSQLVSEEFKIHWGMYLASRKGFIYAFIDGRGSGFQGNKMMHEIHRRLGTVEIEDQIDVTRYIKTELPFVNEEKVALWGNFYGGYATVTALAEDSTSTFKCGMAVAPVSSWRYYDSTYTERYLGLPWPQANYIHYEKADSLKKVSNLKEKKLLLIHGTADDKVLIQHSMMLMKALTDAGVVYETQLYPDESHELDGTKSHFYRTMEDFLDRCFDIKPKVDDEEKGRS